MGLLKRLKSLEQKTTDLEMTVNNQSNALLSSKELLDKQRETIMELRERITSLETELKKSTDYQKEIIEQNKKSQEDRTIILREYLASPDVDDEV